MQAVVYAPHYTDRGREKGQSHWPEADPCTLSEPHNLISHTHTSQTAALECVRDDMPQSQQSLEIWNVFVGLSLD